MNKSPGKNDLESAVPKFCFGLEVHRRTADGRTRTTQEFLAHFFPHDKKSATDRIFRYLPNHVRAPILTAWGVRGKKSALLDDDAKVQSVLHDALVAGDIDSGMFEEALAPDTIMRWIDLSDWWIFWRGGKITKFTILKALESAYDLELFDATWFLDTLRGKGGKLRGTDVLAEGLSKADLTEWVRRVHEGGDGSPRGLVAALGWDQIVAKTEDDVLVAVFDAMAVKVGLIQEVKAAAPAEAKPEAKSEPQVGAKPAAASEAKPEAKPEPKAEAKADAKPPPLKIEPPKAEAPKAEPPKPEPAKPEPPKQEALKAEAGKPAEPPKADAPKLPGILIPSTALKSDGGEESIDSESAANMFKDDELIPISSGTWEDSEDVGDGEHGSKPPGKRSSKNPPAARSK